MRPSRTTLLLVGLIPASVFGLWNMRLHLKRVDRLPEACHGSTRYAEIKPLVHGERRVALLTDHVDDWIHINDERLEPEITVLHFLAQFALAPTVVMLPFSKPEVILEDLGSGLVICDFIRPDARDQIVERFGLHVVKKANDQVWLARYEGKLR